MMFAEEIAGSFPEPIVKDRNPLYACDHAILPPKVMVFAI